MTAHRARRLGPAPEGIMALKPLTYEDPLYQLLRDGNIKEFNRRKTQGEKCELTACDFRHLDLRGLDADRSDFTGCCFRAADLRGIDFSNARLEGASLDGARISGGFFPTELSAAEIALSIQHGLRLR